MCLLVLARLLAGEEAAHAQVHVRLALGATNVAQLETAKHTTARSAVTGDDKDADKAAKRGNGRDGHYLASG